jgi:hypothetical protein
MFAVLPLVPQRPVDARRRHLEPVGPGKKSTGINPLSYTPADFRTKIHRHRPLCVDKDLHYGPTGVAAKNEIDQVRAARNHALIDNTAEFVRNAHILPYLANKNSPNRAISTNYTTLQTVP